MQDRALPASRVPVRSPDLRMTPETAPGPSAESGAAPGAAPGAPSFRAPGGVQTAEEPPTGLLPGVLRFFFVPLLLVGASVAIFAGLGALVAEPPEGPEELVRAVAEGGKNARWQAAQELSNRVHRGDLDLRADERLAGSLAAALDAGREAGDDPRVLQLLAALLGRSHPGAARPALVRALADGNPDVRVFAAAALAESGDPAALPALLARVTDLDDGVRAVAVYAAAVLGEKAGPAPSPELADALGRAIRDPSVEVAWNAALGLARLGDPGGSDLLWAMLHRDYVRANLLPRADEAGRAGFLAAGGSDPATTEDREDRVVLNALSAIYRLRDASMLPAVRDLAERDGKMEVRGWALRTREVLEAAAKERGPVRERTWTGAKAE
jgi:HEAT repeat protein